MIAKPEKDHQPFVADSVTMPELTPIALILGAILGIIFGASSLYLVLKVGLTVSASIPVAVLSITIFRGISKLFGLRRATILENNIVQTTGSAGESIAFGVGVTMPALMILGYDMELGRIMLVAILGGLLGVLMMVPLRYALIVKEHGTLTYPEGTACADVLIVGEKGGTSARTVFTGFFVGLIYKMLNVGFRLWKDTPEKVFGFFKGAALSIEVSPELLGVGYIIGPSIAGVMMAGGVLSSFVLIPAIKLFGSGITTPLFPATKVISQMSLHEIWQSYVLYIGAGAVTAGGIISLFQSMPTIWKSLKASAETFQKGDLSTKAIKRTEQDIPLKYVLMGCVALIVIIWLTPSFKMNLLGAFLIVAFGFLFVTVSSRLTGTIGSSSNPISGMTVATLLLTSLIFLLLGWVGADYRVTALSVAAIVCVAASNGGTTSQDLKTGYLVGATPRHQQIGLLVGAITSALVIGFTLELLNNNATIYSKQNLPTVKVPNVASLTRFERPGGQYSADRTEYRVLHLSEAQADSSLAGIPPGKYLVDDTGTIRYLIDPGINGVLQNRDDGHSVTRFTAPKARLMSFIIDGILTQKLPWSLVLLGISMAVMMELCGVSSLPFAVGVYLPISTSAPIFVGGMIRWLVDRKIKTTAQDSETSGGVLMSTGLIAGGSIAGIGVALIQGKEGWADKVDFSHLIPALSDTTGFAFGVFAVLALLVYWIGTTKSKQE